MSAQAGLNLTYVSRAEDARRDGVLGIATFHDTPAAALGETGIPIVSVDTPVLPTDAPLYEIWSSEVPAESGQQGRVQFRRTPEMLFGCIAVAEQDFAVEE